MQALTVITDADRAEVQSTAASALEVARAYKAVDQASYTAGAELLKTVKGAQKKLADKKSGIVAPLNVALKAVRDLFRSPEDQLEEAEGLIKRSLISYQDEQERQRVAEQRRLDEEARRRREALEAQERAARAKAEAERAAGNLKAAERLEQKADLKADTAATVIAPTVQREAPRVAGVQTREHWYAVVTALEDLIVAVAVGIVRRRADGAQLIGLVTNMPEVPTMALEANMKFLNTQAKAMRKELRYPGVNSVKDNIIASGSR